MWRRLDKEHRISFTITKLLVETVPGVADERGIAMIMRMR